MVCKNIMKLNLFIVLEVFLSIFPQWINILNLEVETQFFK
jgi:hypothetical protein